MAQEDQKNASGFAAPGAMTLALRNFVNKFYSLKSFDPEAYPHVIPMVEDVARELGLAVPPDIKISGGAGQGQPEAAYNALTHTLILSRAELNYSSPGALRATLGHELGHAKQRNTTLAYGAAAAVFLQTMTSGIVTDIIQGNPVDWGNTTMLYTGFFLITQAFRKHKELDADQSAGMVASVEDIEASLRSTYGDILDKKISEKRYPPKRIDLPELDALKAVYDSLLTIHPPDNYRVNMVARLQAERAGNPDKDSPSR